MFTTIDICPEIFSPNIHLCRQILRRIWMDTWSALLLCSETTKIDPAQQIAFSPETYTPPYLISFHGSVAERYVENLKTMRRIGAKKYMEACYDLSGEETLLRQKVYNFYNGPGISLHNWWQMKIAFTGLRIARLKVSLLGLEKVSCFINEVNDGLCDSVSFYTSSSYRLGSNK